MGINDVDVRFKSEEVSKALKLFYEEGDVVELRMPNTNWGTVSGYFNDFDKLNQTAAFYSGKVPGVYTTLNPVRPDLLARAHNHVVRYAKWATSDADILQRRWFGIDVDPVRPSGISSTDEEHEYALRKTMEIRDFLRKQLGWPTLILGDSGNGGHLLSRIDLPNDDSARELIKNCLESLGFLFSDGQGQIDVGVFNAGRIWKLYGTLSCKGDNVPQRPHRLARILEVG